MIYNKIHEKINFSNFHIPDIRKVKRRTTIHTITKTRMILKHIL